MEGKIKIGPVGYNQGGTAVMVNWDEGSHNGIISQIFLSHDSEGIFSIQFQFVLDNKFILSDLHGQNTGYMFNVISLNCPHEYITGISGTLVTSSYSTACPHIKSLKFTTNTNEYGPFGKFTTNTNEYSHFGSSSSSSDKEFKFTLGNQFGGFYGTYDVSGLQYIGVYLQPTTVRPKSKSKTGTSDAEEIESKIVLS